jgi:Zn-dependent peptidase ImmA (M78 family)
MQRAFAAEFLSPFKAVEDMLAGDYSDEKQQDVAEYFEVSPITIRTMLVNRRRIDRDGLDEEMDTGLPEVVAI